MAKEKIKNATGKSEFHSFRMAVNRMLLDGYKTDSSKEKATNLRLLDSVIRDRSGMSMIREGNIEKRKNVIRPELPDTFCNYLYGAFCLHSVQQSSSSTYPILVMQLLAKAAKPMSCNALEQELNNILSAYISDGAQRKLTPAVRQLHQQGIIETIPNEKSTARYRLAPPIPLGIPGEPQQLQLQRLRKLYMLLNLLSERVMPQTLGYHCRATLDLLLQQHGMDPSQIRYPQVIKRDSRTRLMVDDEILWSLLSAHTQNRWVQLEFLSFQNEPVLSAPLQPLFVQTRPGEGRHYLAARPQDPPGKTSCRPVVLPLDRIIRVRILSVTPQERSAEETSQYIRDWFQDSYSGLSPALEESDGKPAAPQEVVVFRKPPEGIADLDSWVQRLKAAHRCQSVDAVGEVYLSRYLLTRPEDLEPILLRDSTVTEINTPGSEFALRFRQRRRLLETYGAALPHSWVEILYPPIQQKAEPLVKDDQTNLFSPWYNWQLRNTMENVNNWVLGEGFGWKDSISPTSTRTTYATLNPDMYEGMCSASIIPAKNTTLVKYSPYVKVPIPARFTYPEMDWLACFLDDPMVSAILGNSYCFYLRNYLLEQLKVGAAQVGYRRRFDENTFTQLHTWGRYNQQLAAFSEIPLDKLVDALTNHHLIDFDNHTKSDGIKSSQNIVPIRLEYMPGARRLRLMMYNPEEDRFFIAPCANMKNIHVHEDPLSRETWQGYERIFKKYLKSTEQSRRLTVSSDPIFLHRAYGVLQPYLDTIYTDDNGAVQITLKYHDFERFHLDKIQGLLFPGVPLPDPPAAGAAN